MMQIECFEQSTKLSIKTQRIHGQTDKNSEVTRRRGRGLGGRKLVQFSSTPGSSRERPSVCVWGCHPAVKQSLSSERRHHNLPGSLTRRRRSQRDVGERPRPPGRSFSRLYPPPPFPPAGTLLFLFLSFLRLSRLETQKGSAAKEKPASV